MRKATNAADAKVKAAVKGAEEEVRKETNATEAKIKAAVKDAVAAVRRELNDGIEKKKNRVGHSLQTKDRGDGREGAEAGQQEEFQGTTGDEEVKRKGSCCLDLMFIL